MNISNNKVRLASYNVETLSVDNPENKREKLQALAESLKEINADIVSLQEVPSEKDLNDFLKMSDLNKKYPYSSFCETNDQYGHHMGILSQYPIVETESNKNRRISTGSKGSTNFCRDVAETMIDVKGYPFRIYNVHFKANPYFAGPDANSPEKLQKAVNKRAAEAREVKNIIAEDMRRLPSMHYVVTGDMNTTPDAPEIQPLKQEDKTHVKLSDPLENLNGPEMNSHPVTNNRLDYIMLSPELAKGVVEGSPNVHHSENANKASDHLGIYVDIDMDALPETDENWKKNLH